MRVYGYVTVLRGKRALFAWKTSSTRLSDPPSKGESDVDSITQKQSRYAKILRPRYRTYSNRNWREVSRTLDTLEAVRARLQAEGDMVGGVKITCMIDDLLKVQRRMLGI